MLVHPFVSRVCLFFVVSLPATQATQTMKDTLHAMNTTLVVYCKIVSESNHMQINTKWFPNRFARSLFKTFRESFDHCAFQVGSANRYCRSLRKSFCGPLTPSDTGLVSFHPRLRCFLPIRNSLTLHIDLEGAGAATRHRNVKCRASRKATLQESVLKAPSFQQESVKRFPVNGFCRPDNLLTFLDKILYAFVRVQGQRSPCSDDGLDGLGIGVRVSVTERVFYSQFYLYQFWG
jgi:hypothetical protein